MNKKILIVSLFATLILLVPFSSAIAVVIDKGKKDNLPPDPPTITGPVEGVVGKEYHFYFVTEDPEGQNVCYYIRWADGTTTDWSDYIQSGRTYSTIHTWYKMDKYVISCKAKDILGAESDWAYLDIPIIKNKVEYSSYWLTFLERFPMLEKLLYKVK